MKLDLYCTSLFGWLTWFTTRLHGPQVRATAASCPLTGCHPWNMASPFLFFILCCSFHLYHPRFSVKIQIYVSWETPCSVGVQGGWLVWKGMINKKRGVMDRELLVYDCSPQQWIYSNPIEEAGRLGSFTNVSDIQAASVMCLDNNAVFVALDMALWGDMLDRFYKLPAGRENVTVIHVSKEGHSCAETGHLAKVQETVIFSRFMAQLSPSHTVCISLWNMEKIRCSLFTQVSAVVKHAPSYSLSERQGDPKMILMW